MRFPYALFNSMINFFITHAKPGLRTVAASQSDTDETIPYFDSPSVINKEYWAYT